METEQIKATINEEITNTLADVRMGREQITIARDALNMTTEVLNQKQKSN